LHLYLHNFQSEIQVDLVEISQSCIAKVKKMSVITQLVGFRIIIKRNNNSL